MELTRYLNSKRLNSHIKEVYANNSQVNSYITDSIENVDTIKLLDGIGYFDAYITPHFNEVGKEAFFDEMDNHFSIALENNTALFISDNDIDYCLDRKNSAIYFYLNNKLYTLDSTNKNLLKENLIK